MTRKGKLPIERQVSAGGIVYRRRDGTVEVLLCGRHEDGVWGLPKGAPNPGESLPQAAMREVTEETGVQVAIEKELGVIHYWYRIPGALVSKEVYHYLMAPTGGDTSQHDAEYDEVVWLPAEEACKTLSYPNEVEMVRQAVASLQGRDNGVTGEIDRP